MAQKLLDALEQVGTEQLFFIGAQQRRYLGQGRAITKVVAV